MSERIACPVEKKFLVDNEKSEAVDLFLNSKLKDFSRRKIRRLLDSGALKLNGKRVRTAGTKVRKGDHLSLLIPEDFFLKEKRLTGDLLKKDDILYFEKDLVVINKPPGLLSQPTLAGGVYLEEEVKKLLAKNSLHDGPLYLCHRLDKETSGVIILALTKKKSEWITEQFKNRKVEKKYLALCYGLSKEKTWTVKNYLSKPDKQGLVRSVRSGGNFSETDFEVLSENKKEQISLVLCKPKTGRTHQIRVHLEASSLPIIGDKRYGQKKLARLRAEFVALALTHHFLHAFSLKFYPEEKKALCRVEASLPKGFHDFCQKMKFQFIF